MTFVVIHEKTLIQKADMFAFLFSSDNVWVIIAENPVLYHAMFISNIVRL